MLLNATDTYSVIPDKLSFRFAEILDCNVTPEFQVALKKMNKKDSTTKLKVCVRVCQTNMILIFECIL